MWLRRFTSGVGGGTRVLLAIAIVAMAGCASGPKPEKSEAQAGPVGAGGVPVDVPAKAQTMFEQATAVMAAGDYLDAELRFKEFLLQYPAYPGGHVNLAIIHTHNGNDEAAEAAIDAALAINPDYAPALNQLGMLRRRNGNFPEAEAAYLKAVTVNPEYALAHYNLGVLNELYFQRLDVALQHFESYQALVGSDKQVEKWIADLRRRLAASQRTANVAE